MMIGAGQEGPGGGAYTPGVGSGGAFFKGAARDLTLKLSDDRSTLTLTLTPNDSSLFTSGVTYSIFWLSPSLYSQNDVYGQVSGSGLSFIQGRQKVADVQGGAGVVSASVPYVPYTSGGWMYAVCIPDGGTKEYRLDGTNFVPVPPLDPTGGPLVVEKPINPSLTVGTLTGNNRKVSFGWTNGASLTSVAYVRIVVQNYQNDGFYRNIALFKVNTPPGGKQGVVGLPNFSDAVDTSQSVILETDNALGGPNRIFYFVPLTSAFVPLALSSCSSVATSWIA